MYTVYIHRNKINNKIYVGQTCDISRRFCKQGKYYEGCPYFYSAIQKYGWDNFSHEIVYINLTKEEANQKESELIKLYNSTNPNYGYNIASGGNPLSEYWENPVHKIEQSERRIQYFKEHPDKRNNLKRWCEEHPEVREEHSVFMKQQYKQGEGALYEINQERKVKILCVETDEVFESQTEACKKIRFKYW